METTSRSLSTIWLLEPARLLVERIRIEPGLGCEGGDVGILKV
ncbi:hypothetical protein [Streptomyces sp. H39-C1]|nr:hypothetical protein [Streptomyces sp. H39-C1]MCZ4097445.1 hypothetical protein [Streptomyces sp. H39-C1]